MLFDEYQIHVHVIIKHGNCFATDSLALKGNLQLKW